MSCKGCGSSKVKNNTCLYCGNPIEGINRDVKYIDVGNLSLKDTAKLVKSFNSQLDGMLVSIPSNYSRPLSDMIWQLR